LLRDPTVLVDSLFVSTNRSTQLNTRFRPVDLIASTWAAMISCVRGRYTRPAEVLPFETQRHARMIDDLKSGSHTLQVAGTFPALAAPPMAHTIGIEGSGY